MPTVYSVVGEHRRDSDRLLALGADGRHYALSLPTGAMSPAEPDDDWRLDPEPPDPETVLLAPPAP